MSNTKKDLKTELETLEAILLSGLDEKFFFLQLSRFIKGHFEVERVFVNKSIVGDKAVFIADSETDSPEEYTTEKGKGVCGHVMRTKRPYYSNSVSRDPLFSGVKESEGVTSELCMPLSVGSDLLATIHLQSTTREFNSENIAEIKEILNAIKRPLQNMKMFLSAKHLNEVLKQQIEDKEKELEMKKTLSPAMKYRIKDIELVGNDPRVLNNFKMAQKMAMTNSPVLLIGESGAGKECLAKKIHMLSKGIEAPFVVINNSIYTDLTFEREFFGYVKGAFPEAIEARAGLVEMATGGTLYIEDVSKFSLNMQLSLLKLLERNSISRIGSMDNFEVDMRVIIASSLNLKDEVEAGRFREDLYFLINGLVLDLPALREREDIAELAGFFLNKDKSPMDHKVLSEKAVVILRNHSWPGNIRELKNAMERAYIMSDGKVIEPEHLPNDLFIKEDKKVEKNYAEMTLEELEKEHIVLTLDHMSGNKTKTAKVLGITVKTLYNKLHSYGMIQSRDSAS